MQPVVAGRLWTSWLLTCSTTTDEAPQEQASARFAGAALAATVKTKSKQTKMSIRPRAIRLQDGATRSDLPSRPNPERAAAESRKIIMAREAGRILRLKKRAGSFG